MKGVSLTFFHSLKTFEELPCSPGLQWAQVRLWLYRRWESLRSIQLCLIHPAVIQWDGFPPHVFTCVFVCVWCNWGRLNLTMWFLTETFQWVTIHILLVSVLYVWFWLRARLCKHVPMTWDVHAPKSVVQCVSERQKKADKTEWKDEVILPVGCVCGRLAHSLMHWPCWVQVSLHNLFFLLLFPQTHMPGQCLCAGLWSSKHRSLIKDEKTADAISLNFFTLFLIWSCLLAANSALFSPATIQKYFLMSKHPKWNSFPATHIASK